MHGSTCCCQSKKLESFSFFEIFMKTSDEGEEEDFQA